MTARVEPARGPLLAAPRRDNVRFGAAVYGSFLVASVVGVAFEAGQDARVMTTTAFASASSSGSRTGGRRSSASRSRQERSSGVATFSSSPVASGHWSKRPSFPRPSSPSPGPACGRGKRAPSSRSVRPSSRSPGGHWSPAVAPDGHGCAPASLPRSMERSASCYCFSRSWFTETRRRARAFRVLCFSGDFSQPGRERPRPESPDASVACFVTAVSPGFRPTTDAPAATSPRTTVGTTVRKR